MNIEQKKMENDTLVLKLEGRLDVATSPELENTVNTATEGIKHLVMDMTELEYISSAGLRVLLTAQKRMNKVGDMKITGVCESVMEVFNITGFVDILNIE